MAVTIPYTSALPNAPDYTEPSKVIYWTTSQNWDIAVEDFQVEQNLVIDAMNAAGIQIEADADRAEAGSNYKGVWDAAFDTPNGYMTGASVSYPLSTSIGYYLSQYDNNTTEPVASTSDANWKFADLSDKVSKIDTVNQTIVSNLDAPSLSIGGVDVATTITDIINDVSKNGVPASRMLLGDVNLNVNTLEIDNRQMIFSTGYIDGQAMNVSEVSTSVEALAITGLVALSNLYVYKEYGGLWYATVDKPTFGAKSTTGDYFLDGLWYDKTNAPLPYITFIDGTVETDGAGDIIAYTDYFQVPLMPESTLVFPAGISIAHAGTTAPDGFIIRDGSELDKFAYVDLYAAIGDTWNNTGGAANPAAGFFRLPPQDISGIGLYDRGVGAVAVGDYQSDVFKSHVHSQTIPASKTSGAYGSDYTPYYNSGGASTGATGDVDETRPRSITMLMCIKY